MSSMKEVLATYQDIIDEYVSTNFTSAAEKRIWQEIGTFAPDLADELTDWYRVEAALDLINTRKVMDEFKESTLAMIAKYNSVTEEDIYVDGIPYSKYTGREIYNLINVN